MKKLLCSSLAVMGLMAFSSPVFAIDPLIHDIADHTIGRGHHHRYYSYSHGYTGYNNYPGYYGYDRPYYRHTHSTWSGGHHHHHRTALGHFGLGHGHHSQHGHHG